MVNRNQPGVKKKKIIVFLPIFPVASEVFIQRDLVKLVELGNLEVAIIALKNGVFKVPEELKGIFYVERLTLANILGILNGIFSHFNDFINKVKIVRTNTNDSLFKSLYLVFKAYGYAQLLKKYKPDELHVHFYSDFSSLACIISDLLGIPFSINAHARDVLEYPHMAVYKYTQSKFVTVCNRNAYTRLLDFTNGDTSKLNLVHHFLDSVTLFSNFTKSKSNKIPVIFMGGTRLTEKKGINFMIEASKILKAKGLDHKVLIMGPDGGEAVNLQKMIQTSGLTANFKLISEAVPFEELAPFYFSSDLFVLPNIQTDSGDVDGIPNVLIEAALAELAIITTDAGSNTELIEEGVTGFIVAQKDANALAEKIAYLLSLPVDAREQLGKNARLKAASIFYAENTIYKLQDLLLK